VNPIKEKRLERGLPRQEVAEAVGVPTNTLKNWEQNKQKPFGARLAKLMAFFQCSAEELGFTPERVQRGQCSAEESVRREANREKARPYIERRLELGLSVTDLAKKAGVHVDTIRCYESGRYCPSWGTWQKVRRALGMPEERSYTEAERNALFFELEDQIRWLIRKNRNRIYRTHMEPDDLYQDLALCALRAIDRFRPDGGANLKTFVNRNIEPLLKSKLVEFYRQGLTGAIHCPLPDIAVFSLEALMEKGLQLESDDEDFAYNEESHPWCSQYRGRWAVAAAL